MADLSPLGRSLGRTAQPGGHVGVPHLQWRQGFAGSALGVLPLSTSTASTLGAQRASCCHWGSAPHVMGPSFLSLGGRLLHHPAGPSTQVRLARERHPAILPLAGNSVGNLIVKDPETQLRKKMSPSFLFLVFSARFSRCRVSF